jgi:hypothetical protein
VKGSTFWLEAGRRQGSATPLTVREPSRAGTSHMPIPAGAQHCISGPAAAEPACLHLGWTSSTSGQLKKYSVRFAQNSGKRILNSLSGRQKSSSASRWTSLLHTQSRRINQELYSPSNGCHPILPH